MCFVYSVCITTCVLCIQQVCTIIIIIDDIVLCWIYHHNGVSLSSIYGKGTYICTFEVQVCILYFIKYYYSVLSVTQQVSSSFV